jgi:agmatinase
MSPKPSINDRTRQELVYLQKGLPPSPTAGLFGASIPVADAQIAILPVPFELTTSYGKGTRRGPEAVRRASHQMDLWDIQFGATYKVGIGQLAADELIDQLNERHGAAAERVIQQIEQSGEPAAEDLAQVNQASERVNDWVRSQATEHLAQGRFVGVLGGDHSVPLGLIQAFSAIHDDFGILHIDAHHDLREAYEGFTYSHASIMANVLAACPQVSRLVAVGIRDFAEDEYVWARDDRRIRTLYDQSLSQQCLSGQSFAAVVEPYIEALPAKVYISFDIDGLDPTLCPSTGTPVPGGLSFQQAADLMARVVASGRQIIGFDLCEVAPAAAGDDWDGNVGARILYKLAGALATSQNLPRLI